MIDSSRGGQEVLVIIDSDKILVSTLDGEILIEHTRPAPRRQLRRQRPTPRPTPKNHRNVTEVLTHELSPIS